MRSPLLFSTLLALGVLPVLPPPKRDVDLAAAEKLIADLQAAGIDACAVVEITGAVDFVVKGRLALQVHETKKAMGEHDVSPLSLLGMVDHLLAGGTAPGFEHGIIDLSDGKPHEIRHEGKLLATVHPHAGSIGLDDVAFTRPRIPSPFAQHQERVAKIGNRIALPDDTSADISRQALKALNGQPRRPLKRAKPDRDRPEQRAAKKTRARTKARRGW